MEERCRSDGRFSRGPLACAGPGGTVACLRRDLQSERHHKFSQTGLASLGHLSMANAAESRSRGLVPTRSGSGMRRRSGTVLD